MSELVLYFHSVGPRVGSQVIRLGSRHLDLLSHPDAPFLNLEKGRVSVVPPFCFTGYPVPDEGQ